MNTQSVKLVKDTSLFGIMKSIGCTSRRLYIAVEAVIAAACVATYLILVIVNQ